MTYVALIKAEDQFYLKLAREKNNVLAFKSIEDALAHFEGGYNEFHARGTTWSASAAINWMTFQPSIIEAPSLDWLVQNVVSECLGVVGLSSMAGSMKGAKTRTGVDKLWEAGVKPRLIS